MWYHGREMTIEEYYRERANEGVDLISIFQEYFYDMGEFTLKEIEFIESKGCVLEDIMEPMVYRVYMGFGETRKLLLETNNYKEAVKTWNAFSSIDGVEDFNGFVRDLYIDADWY